MNKERRASIVVVGALILLLVLAVSAGAVATRRHQASEQYRRDFELRLLAEEAQWALAAHCAYEGHYAAWCEQWAASVVAYDTPHVVSCYQDYQARALWGLRELYACSVAGTGLYLN